MLQKILPEKTNCTGKEVEAGLRKTIFNNFPKFYFEVFSIGVKRVLGRFSPGRHLLTWCHILQGYEKTSIKAPRFHSKTLTLLGYLSWKLLRSMNGFEGRYCEWDFMGYKEKLAAYHLKKLKRIINNLPEVFGKFKDLTDSESALHFSNGFHEFECLPWGILGFNRGRHPDGMMIDDILKDPTMKLDLSVLQELSRTFKEEIMQMPKKELHLTGTAQDEEDLFYEVAQMPEFYAREYEAVVNYETKQVLWPEEFSFDLLMRIKANIGEKAFNKEFQGKPVRGEDCYFRPAEYDAMVRSRLKNYDFIGKPLKLKEYAFGGFDIGKKSHPSHLSILGLDRKGKVIQIHSKFMDGWDYTAQLEYLKQAIEFFNVRSLYYDNTRAEFEALSELGQIPTEMTGVAMTLKMQSSAATFLDTLRTQEKILLLDDKRQRRQNLRVDNDFKSLANKEGHGDCFKSLLLAIHAINEGNLNYIYIV
jgi:hypothetical protein